MDAKKTTSANPDNSNDVLPYVRLQFAITHPDFEECYADGYEAAIACLSEDSNPYEIDTKEYDQWSDGWWDGSYRAVPTFDALIESKEAPVASPLAEAANTPYWTLFSPRFITLFLDITGALVASAVLGYQVLDLVA